MEVFFSSILASLEDPTLINMSGSVSLYPRLSVSLYHVEALPLPVDLFEPPPRLGPLPPLGPLRPLGPLPGLAPPP